MQMWIKMIKYLIIFLMFSMVALAQWNPVDFKQWQNAQQFRKRIGGQYANYERGSDSGWAAIDNNWIASGDSAYECNTSILKTHVDSSGKSIVSIKWGENTYTATSKLNRLMWLRTDTWDTLTIFTNPNWSNHSKDSNIIKWTNVFPAVDYRIRKRNGKVEHGIFFKKAFLDSAVTLYNQRADSAHIALANVIVYTLSANIDNADVALGNLNKRKLKNWGYHYFGIDKAQLFFPGSDTLRTIVVNHRWLKWNDKIICVEYVKMGRIKQIHEAYPNAAVWHNATEKIDGTTNVEDVHLREDQPTTPHGTNTILSLYESTNYRNNSLIRVKNLSSILPANSTISACICSTYQTGSGTGEYDVFEVYRAWTEGGATWNTYDGSNAWGTAGCLNTTSDRSATPLDNNDDPSSATWLAWSIGAALAQAWYDGGTDENGVVIDAVHANDAGKYVNVNSTENGSNPLFWTITYEAGAPPAAGQVIIIQ